MARLLTAALVAGALQVVICLASLGMGFASCAAVRVKDGVRSRGFRWVGTAFFIQALSAVSAAAMSGLDSYFFSGGSFSANRLFTSFYYVAGWFGRISCAAILFVLVQASQIAAAREGSKKSSRVRYWCSLSAFSLLVILSTAAFAELQGFLARWPFDQVNGVSINPPFEKLAGAVDIMILLWAMTALALCAHACIVSRKSHAQGSSNKTTMTLVTAGAVLFWAQTIWTAAESIPMNIASQAPARSTASRMDTHYLAQGVGIYYLDFVVLVLLYVAGRKGPTGLYRGARDTRLGSPNSPDAKILPTQLHRDDEDEEEHNVGNRSPQHQHGGTRQYPAEMAEDKGPVEMEHRESLRQQQLYYGHSGSTRGTPLAAADLPSPVVGNGSMRPCQLPAYDGNQHGMDQKQRAELEGGQQQYSPQQLQGQGWPLAEVHELVGSYPPAADGRNKT
ncbi:hypothetical protein Micbo1qcDRAFT_181292 [Microdochium bolleyi]|uniref:Uncharacterized protein n=1 Tax=Microdochium bolleyi TaxID=196109 RepID=A0A136IIR0_9PEZI|nr:hypothetical protein Micbo1qcDRAFT_181292 [Microdochium bolleyi]